MSTTEKNLNSTKKVVDLTKKENKEKYFNAKKESIKNDSEFNFDDININNIVSKIKVKEKTDRQKMYKFENQNLNSDEQKVQRRKIRNERNKLIDNILFSYQSKNVENLKKNVDLFKTFYLKTYIKNDYTIISLSSNNRDKETTEKLDVALEIIKKIIS
jgi:hypothetical protein